MSIEYTNFFFLYSSADVLSIGFEIGLRLKTLQYYLTRLAIRISVLLLAVVEPTHLRPNVYFSIFSLCEVFLSKSFYLNVVVIYTTDTEKAK